MLDNDQSADFDSAEQRKGDASSVDIVEGPVSLSNQTISKTCFNVE